MALAIPQQGGAISESPCSGLGLRKPNNPVSCERRFQILLRARQARQITEPLMAALASLKMPREVIVTVDVDPVNLG